MPIAKIQKEFDSLPDGYVVLILVDVINYVKVNLEILKYLLNKKRIPGIYITINRPYENMIKTLKKNGIDVKKLFFIDCITQTVGGNPEKKEGVLFVASPQSLTDIGIALSEALESIKAPDKFLFLDSLSTLLIYNNSGTIAKFSHFIASKMRLKGFKGIFISIEKETDATLIRILSQFCDKTIKFGGK
jgi:KaiC/GvpD/RAD55 family RecA-like ATPase